MILIVIFGRYISEVDLMSVLKYEMIISMLTKPIFVGQYIDKKIFQILNYEMCLFI